MSRQPDAPDPAELATVRRLPVRQDGEVVDGVLVDEDEYARLADQRTQAAMRLQGYGRDVVLAATTVRTVATHRRTRRAGRAIARHGAYVLAGALIVARRLRDTHGSARYERMLRAAEAAGDHELMLRWEERAEQAKAARHQRRMDRHQSSRVKYLAKTTGWAAGASLAAMLALGVLLAAATSDPGYVLAPIRGVLAAIGWTAAVVAVVWGPLIAAAPWLLVIVCHQVGRRAGAIPDALAPVQEPHQDARAILPTTGAILDALRHLRLPALNDAFKAGWASPSYPMRVWITDPHRDGQGWRAQIALPQGVPVSAISAPRIKAVLAHNLVRQPVEVWPMEPRKQPGVLDLWVADQGFLTGPVPPWPLLAKLETAQTDYWKGVPVGVNIKGDVVVAKLFESNFAAAGVMGSGKSTFVITMLLGAILDPLVDVDVFVCAENADYDPMKPRLNTLVTGIGPNTVDEAIKGMTSAYASLQDRGRALKNETINPEGSRSITRRMAERDPRCRPRIIVIDECQRLFLDENRGEEAVDIAVQLINTARKYATNLVLLTPEPTSGSLPRRIMSVISHKLCYAIGDQTSNDAVLGTGSYRAGVSAVGLEPKTDEGLGDVGTAMTRGFYSMPGLLRSYYVGPADAHRITQRAMQLWAGHRPSIGTDDDSEERDLLEDVETVMGGAPRVRSDWARRQLADRWPEYETLSAQQFAKDLAAAGVTIHSGRVDGVGGQKYLSLDEVMDAIDERSQEADEDPDEAGEDE